MRLKDEVPLALARLFLGYVQGSLLFPLLVSWTLPVLVPPVFWVVTFQDRAGSALGAFNRWLEAHPALLARVQSSMEGFDPSAFHFAGWWLVPFVFLAADMLWSAFRGPAGPWPAHRKLLLAFMVSAASFVALFAIYLARPEPFNATLSGAIGICFALTIAPFLVGIPFFVVRQALRLTERLLESGDDGRPGGFAGSGAPSRGG